LGGGCVACEHFIVQYGCAEVVEVTLDTLDFGSVAEFVQANDRSTDDHSDDAQNDDDFQKREACGSGVTNGGMERMNFHGWMG
jgi:hypothetical protein